MAIQSYVLAVCMALPSASFECPLADAPEPRDLPSGIEPEKVSHAEPAVSLAESANRVITAKIEGSKSENKTSGSHTSPPTHGNALTLDDLERIALESNPTLVQATMAVSAAQGQHLQAGLYPNPAVGYVGADIGLERTEGQQGGMVSQEIVTFGKLRKARAAASWQVQQSRHAWEAQQQRVLNDVRSGYYEVLLAQKTIDLNEQLVRIGEQGVGATEKLRAAMEVSRADVLQAQIEADTAKLDLTFSRNRYQAAWRRLTAVLGQPDMEPQPLIGDVESNLPEFKWEDSLIQLLAQSPVLAQAKAGVQKACHEVSLQRAERWPNLEIAAGAKRDATALMTLADVEVSVPIPIFNRNQGNILSAQAEYVSAVREVERVELALRDQLAEVFEQYANSRQRVKTYSASILPNAKESLGLVSAGYREGEFDYLTLLTAQRTYFSVSLEYLDSLSELWARAVTIKGLLLSGGLEGE